MRDHKMNHCVPGRWVGWVGISLLGAVGCVPNSPDQLVADYTTFVADFIRQFLAAWLF